MKKRAVYASGKGKPGVPPGGNLGGAGGKPGGGQRPPAGPQKPK